MVCSLARSPHCGDMKDKCNPEGPGRVFNQNLPSATPVLSPGSFAQPPNTSQADVGSTTPNRSHFSAEKMPKGNVWNVENHLCKESAYIYN